MIILVAFYWHFLCSWWWFQFSSPQLQSVSVWAMQRLWALLASSFILLLEFILSARNHWWMLSLLIFLDHSHESLSLVSSLTQTVMNPRNICLFRVYLERRESVLNKNSLQSWWLISLFHMELDVVWTSWVVVFLAALTLIWIQSVIKLMG